jgi:hypothetical protein
MHLVTLVLESSSHKNYESHIRLAEKVFIIFSTFFPYFLLSRPHTLFLLLLRPILLSFFLSTSALQKMGENRANNYHINFEAQSICWHEEYVKIYQPVG